MNRLRKAAIGSACVFIVAMVIAGLSWKREPTYEGKPLSEWVLEAQSLGYYDGGRVGEALRGMGTDCVPILLRWIQYQPRPLRYKVMFAVSKINRRWGARLQRGMDVAWAAPRTFGMLGPDARVAIPDLTRLAKEGKSSQVRSSAMMALASFGDAGIDLVLRVGEDSSNPDRRFAIRALRYGDLGTNRDRVLGLFVECITNRDSVLACAAAEGLGRVEGAQAIALGGLIQGLAHNDTIVRQSAVRLLGNMGPAASNAVPALEAALNDSDATVRGLAGWALKAIKQPTETRKVIIMQPTGIEEEIIIPR